MKCCAGGQRCSLPLCPIRKGESALGHPRQKPSVRGRDKREAEYARLHTTCEIAGCGLASAAVHHQTRRGLGGWNRDKSPLRSLCRAHHELAHGIAP